MRQSPKVPTRSRIDESKTAVSTGLTPKIVSNQEEQPAEAGSDSSDGGEVESEDENPKKVAKTKVSHQKTTKQIASQDAADVDTEMTSPKPDELQEQGDASGDESASPTFGELLRGASTVDVATALAAQVSDATAPREPRSRALAPVSATSLGTVLNQALKSDDADLLESCLQVSDIKMIQSTINRMDSSLALALLSKLADRMHRRPGRALGLMKWIQWTLVAHGGALVAQPRITQQLSKLSSVLEERARGLPSLLALKGKLDLLDAQMQLRRSIKEARAEGSDDEGSEDVDEPGVVYVEGQEDEPKTLTNGTAATRGGGLDEEDDFPAANGIIRDSEDDSDEDEDDDLIDDMAEVESMDEDDVDHDDVEDESGDEDEEADDDEEPAPPSKVQKVSSKFAKGK